MADIFLSYATPDRETARILADHLESFGFDVWWDREIGLGKEFSVVIDEEITKAKVVLVLWSQQATQSEWVRDEASEAKDQGKLISVLIENVKPPMGFRQFQACILYDNKEINKSSEFHKLTEYLRTRIPLAVDQDSPNPVLSPAEGEGSRLIRGQIEIYLDTGDRFVAQGELDQAINEYEKAIELDKQHIEAHRRIISTMRERILIEAFTSDVLDIGLRNDYDSFIPVPDLEINSALKHIYEFQALHPSLKDDVNLMLDEASILKAGGARAKNATSVLERAHELHPENSLVLAELGLLRTITSGEQIEKAKHIELIRRAIKFQPNEARYHFYLARSLSEAYRCTYRGPDYSVCGEAGACAEAIREYHVAAELASADDVWSRHIRYHAPNCSMDIFHRYGNKEEDILTSNLDMSFDERIKEIEFLLARNINKSSSGPKDNPRFWLATLYHVTNDNDKAEKIIGELVEEYKAWKYKSYQPWLKLYVKIMEENGRNDSNFTRIQTLVKKNEVENSK